eukprot:Ihof_evm1s1310 gene=Ihof_evmTU1s1310
MTLTRFYSPMQVKTEDDTNKYNGEVATIKVKGCRVEMCEPRCSNCPFGLVVTSTDGTQHVLAFPTNEEMKTWLSTLQSVSQEAEGLYEHISTEQQQYKQGVQKIERTLSDLVGYCRPVQFKSFEESLITGKCYEMSSFPEQLAMKRARKEAMNFVKYNKRQMCRVYPMGKRVDSSNYDPQPLWNVGAQMVALNFQTGDRPMQLHHGKFRQNGNSGYQLKPLPLRDEPHPFNPHDISTFGTNQTPSVVWNVVIN